MKSPTPIRARTHRLEIVLTAVAGLSLGLAAPGVAAADEVTVRCGDITGLVSAITVANGASRPSRIVLGSPASCTFTLTTAATAGGPNAGGQDGLPIITGSVTIVGGTIARSSQSGTPLFRIFEVAKGGTLTLDGVTVKGGRVNAKGGGIFVDGRILLNPPLPDTNASGFPPFIPPGPPEQPGVLNLNHSAIIGNTAVDNGNDETLGGGVHSRGTTTITDSVISDNSVIESVAQFPDGEVVAEGGGLTNTGRMTIRRSRIVNNHAISTGENLGAFGGALGSFSEPDFFAPAFLVIEDSVISGNTTTGRYAEAAAMEVEHDTTIRRTIITNNTSTARGDGPIPPCSFDLAQCNSGSAFADGAVLNQGDLKLIDVLLEGNRSTAIGGPHPVVEGAALTNSGTFRRNQFAAFPGRAELINTIVRNNVATAIGPGSEVRGGAIANADHSQFTNPAGTTLAGIPLILTNSVVFGNSARAQTAHGGGIYNFGNDIAQNSDLAPRVQGVVTIDRSLIFANSPNNCEQQNGAPIDGCTGLRPVP